MNWLHNIRVFIISTLAVVLIVLAVLFSVMRALLPHATGYLEDIQAELTAQLNLPVSIGSLDADMDWLVPRLKIIDLIIYKKNGEDELIHFSEAGFSLSYIETIRYLMPMVGAINLVGAEFFIERHDNNRWVIQGQEVIGDLKEKNAGTSQLIQALENINYSLLDSHIHWSDFTHKTENIELKGVDVKIESFLNKRNIDIKVGLPKQYGESMRITAELEGDILYPEQLTGKVYFNGESLIIEKWLGKIEEYSDIHVKGVADASLWVYFEKSTIKKLSGGFANTNIEVSNPKLSKIIWSAEKLDFQFLYRMLSNGWRLDVDQLNVLMNGKQWLHESQLLFKEVSGVETTFSANYLRLQDVIPLAYLFTGVEDNEILRELNLKDIMGDIYNTDVRINATNNERFVRTTVEDLAFNLKNKKMSSQGIDGTITVLNNAIKLSLDSRQLRLDLPEALRAPIEMDVVTGDVEIVSNGSDFTILTSNILAASTDFNLESRFDINHSAVADYIDMQVNFFDVNTKALRQYYPVTLLSAGLISWMDDAINEGKSEEGSFVFRGNPNNFPFYKSDGVMEVDFSVNNLNLHYLDGWPNLENLNSNIRFYNESLTIENGTGRIQDGRVYDVIAVIPDLNNPVLTVTGKAEADARNVQAFIWNSGLDVLLGDAVRHFSMKGDTKLDFHLTTPLSGENKVKVDGKLSFVNAQLELPMLNYLLSDINGDFSFTENEMSADNIQAKFGNNKVEIDIVPINTSDNHESVININGDLDADILLNSFEWIPKDWISGHSSWKAGIHIPYTEKEYSLRVSAQSQLNNVLLNVSDGLQKNALSTLPVDLEVLVLSDGLKINIESDGKFKAKTTRDSANNWNIDIRSDIATGNVKFKQGLDTDSTVYMNFDTLDLDALMSRKTKKNTGEMLPSNIPSLEVRLKHMLWDDWEFSNISISSIWQPHGMLIKAFKLEAPSLLIDGHGSWLLSQQKNPASNFKFNISSKNLGVALDSLGFTTGLKQSVLTSTSDWQWRDDPYSFSWGLLKGDSTVTLRDGVMQDISPGNKGRLLGLFNILALPKRFSLDFGDVYKDGFAFDKVTTNFKFENGNATTKRIDVKASAADVRMFGRIGMQNQDYDVDVLVKPHSKGAAFTGGTLIGGPILGAGLVLLQNLFKLDELAYDKYTITGPWDNPVTTRKSTSKKQNPAANLE